MTAEIEALIAQALKRDADDKLARMLRVAVRGMTDLEYTIEEALVEIERIAKG